MPKKIVICCDGTGNQINDRLSNVLKFYRVLQKTDDQLVYYSPGVGTVGDYDSWQVIKQHVHEFLGLATGYGLDDNVLDAYRFLCMHYDEGDSIWLFGFSRGAYTVRVLAAFIQVIGLLPPDQIDLGGYAFSAYKSASARQNSDGKFLDEAWHFSQVAGGYHVPIEFLGVWDTVASVIVPRPDRLLLDLQSLRFTRTNPGVEIFRQAISVDERRRMFRLHAWTEPQTFKTNPFNNKNWRPQDIRQVWFAGVHADIGGGYAEAESGLSKFPLLWMINQARTAGLRVNTAMINHLVLGKPRRDSARVYVAPDADAPIHRSLKGPWWTLEIIPKLTKFREWPRRWSLLGLYLPLAEPRRIPDWARIHASLVERLRDGPGYRPVNLPARYRTVR